MADAAGPDQSEICTVLVGCTSANIQRHNLRVHRFRVDAASGRVLGRRDDVLERFAHVAPAAADVEQEVIPDARAALSGDGQLYLLCDRWRLYPQWSSGQEATSVSKPAVVMAFDLANRKLSTVCALDDITFASPSCWPVSAAGKIWVLYLGQVPDRGSRTRLVMQRLDKTSFHNLRPLVDVGFIDLPRDDRPSGRVTGSSIFGGYAVTGKASLLQGYAVIGNVILISLANCDFYCFHCTSNKWSRVATTIDSSQYVPLNGRAVYVAEQDHIYFFRDNHVLAYKFLPTEEMITPPIKLQTLYPSNDFGNGFLTNLGSQVLCAVWVGMTLPCECTTRHMLITTMKVIGTYVDEGFVPNDIQILHSTCRRVQMMSTMAQDRGFDKFCFLQYVNNFCSSIHGFFLLNL